MTTLANRTSTWRSLLYTPACAGAPEFCSADVEATGALTIEAKIDGTKAAARQISNASDLRATLLAFLLAFWQHLLDTRGGLSLLIFDDLHELFDPTNRRRLADALPAGGGRGAKVVLSSNDYGFGADVAAAVQGQPRRASGPAPRLCNPTPYGPASSLGCS